MPDVDDVIRDELARLVRPADTEAVMAAVASRRVVTEPRRRKSWLVAAAVIAVLGVAGLGLASSRSDGPSVTASAGGPDGPAWLPAVVPGGAALVSVHTFPPDGWEAPAQPWATPGRSTLSYRDLTHPAGEPGFDLEVFPGMALDVDAARAGLGDDSELVRVGGAAGVRVRGLGASTSDRIIWQVSGSVLRIDAIGISSDEALAVATSVRTVDEATWAEALDGADIAPPYGFRGETATVSGNGWAITAGMYRQTFGLPSGCAVLELDDPRPDDLEVGDPACVSPFPVPEAVRADVLVDVHHVWVDDRLLVWGVPAEGARSVRLVYDEGTFVAALGGTDGPFRAERIPGVDTLVFVGELDVARQPSRVEVLSGAGTIISSYEDATSRELPPPPDRPTTTVVVPAAPDLDDQQIAVAEQTVSAFVDDCRRGDLTAAAARWSGYPYVAPEESSDKLSLIQELVDDPSFARILGGDVSIHVTPSWGSVSSAPVVTLVVGREGERPPVAIAFLVGAAPASAGQDPREVLIQRLPEVGAAEADPPPGASVSPGLQIRVPGTPVEGGARAFVGDEEVAVVVDYEKWEMTFSIPEGAAGDIAVTLSVATPEVAGAGSFAYTVR